MTKCRPTDDVKSGAIEVSNFSSPTTTSKRYQRNVGHFAYKTFRLLDTLPTTWTLRLIDISPTGHFAYSVDSSPTHCEHKRMKMCDIHCVPKNRTPKP